MATALEVNPQTIRKWASEGMPISERGRGGRPSRYDLMACQAWLDARTVAADRGEATDLIRERARKERAQAVLAEQTFAVRARTLIPADEIEKVWAAEVAAVRSVVLSHYQTAADRVHRVSVLEGLPGVERTLKELAHDVLRELANPDREPMPKGAQPS